MPQITADTPWFTQGEFLASIANAQIENREFQIWLQRGHVTVQDANPGRGKVRKLSFAECAHINAFAIMVRSGEKPRYAGRIAKLIHQRAIDLADGRQWDLQFLETDPGFQVLACEINEHGDEDNAYITARFLSPSNLGGIIGKTGGGVLHIIEADYFIWRTWVQIDQELPNSRQPWGIYPEER